MTSHSPPPAFEVNYIPINLAYKLVKLHAIMHFLAGYQIAVQFQVSILEGQVENAETETKVWKWKYGSEMKRLLSAHECAL